jgi:hypothetical protein
LVGGVEPVALAAPAARTAWWRRPARLQGGACWGGGALHGAPVRDHVQHRAQR